MLRFKIRRLIRILESEDSASLTKVLQSPKYMTAFNALEEMGCVKVVRSAGGAVHQAWLTNRSSLYQLNRQDIWANRIGGFITGVISGVMVTLIASTLL